MALFAVSCGSDADTSTDSSGDSSSDTSGGADTAATASDSSSDAATSSGASASGEPIKIGSLTSLTGPFTSWGIHASAGMQLAVDEINEAGGVDGRMLELVIVDDQSDAEEASIQLERLHEEGVVAVAGTISSGVAGAISPIAEEASVPLFLSKAGSEAILTSDSRYTFRTCLPAGPMIAQPFAEYAEGEGFTRVGSMIADYAWGQSFKGSSADAFSARGIELQAEVAPVPEKDFTTYLRSLEAFEPELIMSTGHPPGTGSVLVQVADLGLDVDVTGPGSSLSAVMEAAGDTAIDRYIDLSCADYNSDAYADLSRRYLAATDHEFMEDDAVAGHAVVTIVADAIRAVGTDPSAIADHVRGESYDMPGMAYPMSWTGWGELEKAQLILVRVGTGPAPDGLGAGGWWPETLIKSAVLTPYEPA